MNDSHVTSATGADLNATAPATYRLTIRARIVTEAPPSAVQSPLRRHARVLIGASAVALLALAWVAVNTFSSHSPAAETANPATQGAELRSSSIKPASDSAAPGNSTAPRPQASASGAVESVGGSSSQAESVESHTLSEPDVPPSPITKVSPAASRSALETIRGTIRVTVRVAIDKHGAVLAATTRDPGPSRYFERLSLEASRQWTLTPANTEQPRSMLLLFHFRRDGVTARAEPVQ